VDKPGELPALWGLLGASLPPPGRIGRLGRHPRLLAARRASCGSDARP
jgi:hypothetical protein